MPCNCTCHKREQLERRGLGQFPTSRRLTRVVMTAAHAACAAPFSPRQHAFGGQGFSVRTRALDPVFGVNRVSDRIHPYRLETRQNSRKLLGEHSCKVLEVYCLSVPESMLIWQGILMGILMAGTCFTDSGHEWRVAGRATHSLCTALLYAVATTYRSRQLPACTLSPRTNRL